jgi:hypothetical protein
VDTYAILYKELEPYFDIYRVKKILEPIPHSLPGIIVLNKYQLNALRFLEFQGFPVKYYLLF